MRIGEVVTTKKMRVIIQEGAGYLDYKLPVGKAFVFMLLGTEDIKGPDILDKEKAEQVFNNLGWYRRGEPVAWQHRGHHAGEQKFGEWCDGRNQIFDTADGAKFEERRLYAA